MSCSRLLLWTVALAAVAVQPTRAQDADSRAIDAFIARQARIQNGTEYRDARKVVVGDVDGDGTADAVVLYTIEGQHGSNNYVQCLAVFTRAKGALTAPAHTEVGGKNYRSADLVGVERDGVHLDTLGYAPNDPSCCPTIKGSAVYELRAGRLVEVKPAGAQKPTP